MGKLGDVVYYKRSGKTFIRQAPGSYNKIPTEKQAAARVDILPDCGAASGVFCAK